MQDQMQSSKNSLCLWCQKRRILTILIMTKFVILYFKIFTINIKLFYFFYDSKCEIQGTYTGLNLIVFFLGVVACFLLLAFLQHISLNIISTAMTPIKPIAIAKLGNLTASATAYLIFLCFINLKNLNSNDFRRKFKKKTLFSPLSRAPK